MLGKVLNFLKNFLPWPTHNIEGNNVEYHTISRKRSGDVLNSDIDIGNSFPNKRPCLDTHRPIVGSIGNKVHSHQALPHDSDGIDFLKPDSRRIYPTMPRKSKLSSTYCITGPMDSKSFGASFSSSQSPNQGKENIIEISDEDDGICQAAHTRPSTKTRADRACWVTAEPKHNPTSKSFQRSCSKEKNKTVNDNFSSASKSSDFTTRRPQWPVLGGTSRPTPISRPHNRFARGNPLVNRTKRFDNRMYNAVTPSAARGIEETFRLEEKNTYSQLLKHYFDRKPHSTESQNTATKFNEMFDNKLNLVVSFTKTKDKVEFIDLTARMKERKPVVRRDQEIKPQTLASNLADGPVDIASTSRPKAQTSLVNSFEEMLKLHSCSEPRFLDDVMKKFEERKRNIQESLKEPQLRAKEYAHHNDEVHIERVFRHIAITDSEVVLDDVLEEEVPALPTLLPRMQQAIDAALRPNPPQETLVESFSLQITRRDMHTLANLNWLNDEVINFYMNLLIERGKRDKFPSVYAFNTFFYGKLLSNGFVSLKRWTRKVDIFSHDIIIVPVHLGVHWCMAAIDFRDKTIRYYDSMGASNNKCLNALSQYLEEESVDKKKTPYDTSCWKKINVKDNPQQMNGSDCGVFACIYSEYICRNAKISFTQADMPYFRRKMVFEILSAKLLDFT